MHAHMVPLERVTNVAGDFELRSEARLARPYAWRLLRNVSRSRVGMASDIEKRMCCAGAPAILRIYRYLKKGGTIFNSMLVPGS